VIDEVLAVGDAEFQRKCLNKMEDVSRSGRTILFVSHQLNAIDALCNKGLVLHEGKTLFNGTSAEAMSFYLEGNLSAGSQQKKNEVVTSIEVHPGNNKSLIESFDDVVIECSLKLPEAVKNPTIGFVVRNAFNIPVLGINNRNYGVGLETLQDNKFKVRLINAPLLPGSYTLDLFIGSGPSDIYHLSNIYTFEVSERNLFEGGKNPDQRLNSFVIKDVEWQLMPR
jgi:lipopolysaccharide transport system ATP-binding protein